MKDPAQIMSMKQPTMLNQQQVMNNQKSQMLINQPQLMNPSQMMMNHSQSQRISQSQMFNRGGYGMWPPVDQLKFQNPMTPAGFVSSSKPVGRNSNWKGKKGNDKRNRKEKPVAGGSSSSGLGMGGLGGVGYKPPALKELQQQNRLKARRYFPKKKFNNRSAPYAPRNTTSFIIRAKKAGGITSLVSPCPVTPAVLPTPIFSPSREVLVDMAKEEWGVDGYGSMKGLIRLRSPGNEAEASEDEEEEEGGSSESDVEEHLEVERRLDHDLSRFEMIYPNYGGAEHNNNLLENRVDDQDTHIAQLEEENLILKERLFLMEREFNDLRRRLQCLERQNQTGGEINEEVVENESDNGSESRGYDHSIEENNEVVEQNNEGQQYVEVKVQSNYGKAEAKDAKNIENKVDVSENVGVGNDCMEEHMEAKVENNDRFLEAREGNNDEFLEAREGNNDGFFEAKEGNNDGFVEAKDGNGNGAVETKQKNNGKGSKNVGVDDVCMDELGLAHDEVIAENQS